MARWIAEWNPEDETFWRERGRRIARRNLVWSIVAENIGFSVWLVWSVTAARLPSAGFPYTTDQLFLLVAIPGLVGAFMRFPYTFAVPRFGGRNWTVASALLLFVPTLALVALVTRPTTPFWLMALAAATAGLGGGNFASSMANISFFYPDREKGFALGLNAAGGNIGVSTVQLLVPIVIVLGGGLHLANAGLMWMPLIAVAAVGAFTRMDNLASARSTFSRQAAILRSKHTWIVSLLYIGTFGSFVGYSAAFPLLLKTQFPEVHANLAFLGPLVGSLARPVGGKMADRLGGAKVTLVTFFVMTTVTLGLVYFTHARSFAGFLGSFLALFVMTGVGNGSVYRMIPSIFRAEGRDAAAALGFIAATGALGGYFVPQAFSASIRATGGPAGALAAFVVVYAVCVGVTWWCYARPAPIAEEAPSLAA
jgi:NNP family nitrate/nitrite transporter-like MFS transporter